MGNRLMAKVDRADFIGREREMEVLERHLVSRRASNGMLVLSAPGIGGSELLRQFYDGLFVRADGGVPFYFSFDRSDRNARRCAERFVKEFIRQVVAFRRRDTKLLNITSDLDELSQLALPGDSIWIDRLVAAFRAESRVNDDISHVDTCFAAPVRAAANGVPVVVIIDDIHETAHLEDGGDAYDILLTALSRSDVPFIVGGHRRFVSAAESFGFEILPVEPLEFAEAGLLVEALAQNSRLEVSPEARDLLAVQFHGNPLFLHYMVQAASELGQPLLRHQQVQQVYVDELCGGRIGRYFDGIFETVSSTFGSQREIVSMVHLAMNFEPGGTHAETWEPQSGLDPAEFSRMMAILNSNEVISLTSNIAEASPENRVLSDYLAARHSLEVDGRNRSLTVGALVAESLKRAPQIMARFYRRKAAIGLRDILESFRSREVPAALIDYGRFKDRLKGMSDSEVDAQLAGATDTLLLPEIVYTSHTGTVYPAFEQMTERERSAVGFGFSSSFYTPEDEVVWLAVEIDVKLEAARDITEFWCDWLELVAQACNFQNYRLWLISPEGFQDEAIDALARRRAFGSSRQQVQLLKRFLGAVGADSSRSEEFEIAVPMKGDAELIAAQTVEEIARRHNVPAKTINQIKTALVEACINATEHSLSPDQKIYQKFSVNEERLTITVSNRGLRMNDKVLREDNPTVGRRGWGLKLMKSLMDDVQIHEVDDGTRITMTKVFGKEEPVSK